MADEDKDNTTPTRTTRAQAPAQGKTYGRKTDETIVQRLEREQAQGFRGTVPDPTPNEHYTVGGVTAGLPTPETDKDAFDAARSGAAKRFDGN